MPIEMRALEGLGKGFDLASDFRLKFAKGIEGRRLVELDEVNKRDILIPGGATIKGVSEDIRCDKGDRIRFKSDVLEFNQVCFFLFCYFLFQAIDAFILRMEAEKFGYNTGLYNFDSEYHEKTML